MSTTGPVPKRSTQRRRNDSPGALPLRTAPGAVEVEVPEAKKTWHPIARRWYESLAKSGQSVYYEPSDWATAYLVAESMSRDLLPVFVAYDEKRGEAIKVHLPINGARMAGYLRAMQDLVVTEGARRRARIELERPKPGADGEGGSLSWIDQARRRPS